MLILQKFVKEDPVIIQLHLTSAKDGKIHYKIRTRVAVAKQKEVDQMEMMAVALEHEQDTTTVWTGTSTAFLALARSTVASARKTSREVVRPRTRRAR